MSLLFRQTREEEPAEVDRPGLESWLSTGRVTFWMRVTAWVLAPVLFATLSSEVAATIVLTWLSVSIILHLLYGRVLWLSLHPIALSLMIIYTGAAAWIWNYQGIFDGFAWATLCTLIVLIASDVISLPRRAVMLSVIMLGVMFESRFLMGQFPDRQILELLWPAGAIAGGAAAVGRRSWPTNPDDLIQTRLDYGRWRLEILSYGMKKALAIGIGWVQR